MRKYIKKEVFLTIGIFCFQLLYLMCQPFPKGFGILSGWKLTSDIITNYLYFFITFPIMLYYAAGHGIIHGTDSERNYWKTRDFWKKLFLLMVVESGFLLISRVIRLNTYYATALLTDMLTTGSVFVLWWIIAGHKKDAKMDIHRQKVIKLLKIIGVIVFILCVIFDVRDVFKNISLAGKYVSFDMVKIKRLNMSYAASWRNFALETVLWAMVIGKSVVEQVTGKTKEKLRTPISKIFSRYYAISLLISVVFILKILFLPLNLLSITMRNGNTRTSRIVDTKEYIGNVITARLVRSKIDGDWWLEYNPHYGKDGDYGGTDPDYISYYLRHYSIGYGDEWLFSFTTDDFDDNEEEKKIEIPVGDTTVVVWHKQAIYYIQNDAMTATKLDDLATKQEDKYFIAAVEEMIRRGYWEFFENGYSYLLNYDPDFIRPYIDRYAAGAFTEEELTVSAEIRTDYRQSFAQEIVNTILARR